MIMRSALLAAAALIAACDSGTAYRADLGQGGKLPAIEATIAAAPAGGQTLSFTGMAGGALPVEFTGIQSARLAVSGTQLPLFKAGAALTASVPPTLPQIAKPLDDKPIRMAFILDNDRTLVANVTFK